MTGFRQLVDARGWNCGEPAVADRQAPAGPFGLGRPGFNPTPAKLARTIEAEIIPRLLLAHRVPDLSDPAGPAAEPSGADVADFAELILDHDTAVAAAFVEVFRARGLSLETIFLHLLAPTARLLGDLWKEDVLTFTDVTVGLARLQHLLRELSAPFESEAEHAFHGRRALIAPAPGEQHTFGILMVEEFFRRAGWDVAGGPRTPDEILFLVRREWFDLVGLSASCDLLFDGLAGLIGAIRRASRNRAVGILVGGRLFNEHPELVARAGADATAVDGRQAVRQLPRLIGLAAKRC